MITPINEPRYIQLDQRDWDSWRDRILALEEENRDLRGKILHLNRDFALFMAGVKERFNVINLLLSDSQSTVARKDV